MSYAQVTDDTITAVGGLPKGARRLDDGGWVLGLRDADISLQEACGWFQVVDVARPADTATDTYDRTVELLVGTPTVVWTVRLKTQAELDSDTAQEADTTLRDQARTAFAANKLYLDSTPGTAEAIAQVDALTAQMNRMIRLVVDAGLVE